MESAKSDALRKSPSHIYDKTRIASDDDALSMLPSMRREYLSREEKKGGRKKSEKSSQ